MKDGFVLTADTASVGAVQVTKRVRIFGVLLSGVPMAEYVGPEVLIQILEINKRSHAQEGVVVSLKKEDGTWSIQKLWPYRVLVDLNVFVLVDSSADSTVRLSAAA